MDKVFRVNDSVTIFLKDVDFKGGDKRFVRGCVNVVLKDRTEILLTEAASNAFISVYEDYTMDGER